MLEVSVQGFHGWLRPEVFGIEINGNGLPVDVDVAFQAIYIAFCRLWHAEIVSRA